ncbi:MAG: DUF4349 domain-containing protein [Chloroflexota bacterium]
MMKSSMDSPEMAVMIDSRGISSSEISNDTIDKKIQKNANINIEVKDLEESILKTNQMISTFKGEIISTNSGGIDFGQPYANIRFRVPSGSLEEVVIELKKFSSKVISENVYTNDVTEEFIDVEAKLNIMKSTEKRFSDLLADAKSVEEVIQVEKELMRIRGDIDSLEGRLNYLSQTTDTSEINLNMNEEVPITGEKWRFNDSLSSALQNLSSFAKGFADLLINLVVFVPVIIVGILIIIIIRILIKRRHK